MSGRIDPRLAKMEVKVASQRRPESVPLPRAERTGGVANMSQAVRPDTACGGTTPTSTAPMAGLADDQPSSGLGFQPYRPTVMGRTKHHDPGTYAPLTYPPTAAVASFADGLAGFENGGTSAPADWESRDEMRQRELDEMRARVAQMEKTMRWWSDCTANWREKWSKVRGERNKARDECRQLRARLDEVMKDCALHKREKLELMATTSKESAAISAAAAAAAAAGEPELRLPVASSGGEIGAGGSNISTSRPENSVVVVDGGGFVPAPADGGTLHQVDSMIHIGSSKWTAGDAMPSGLSANAAASAPLADTLRQLQDEREQKAVLVAKVEQLDRELDDAREQLSRCRAAGATSRPTADTGLASQPNVREGEDESVATFKAMSAAAEKQLAELRAQLEVLQADNASEWARRERTDSERYALERDNKKLKAQLDDLRLELDKRTAAAHGVKEGEVKAVQKELSERNKEIAELRHSHGKLKRLLQERSLELEHSKRRADQYEAEVRKLRTRVDELKRELAETQDELDSLGNANKKLQRTVDELQESNESLGIQLEHAQSRLKSTAADALDYFKNRTIKSAGLPGDEDSTDAFDSDDEFVT